MEKIFGIPTSQLLTSLVVILLAGTLIMAVVALRNRVMFKLALRNIPRRRTQTALIILGLMLATLLFSASFATGDTLTHSIRVSAVKRLGQVDERVVAAKPEIGGRVAAFDQAMAGRVKDTLASVPEVDAVAPMLSRYAPVLLPKTRLSAPSVEVLGIDPSAQAGFDSLEDGAGRKLSLASLSENRVFLSAHAAEAMNAGVDDTVQAFFSAKPTELQVAGIYARGANPAGEDSMVLPLARLQTLMGLEGKISAVVISNKGGPVDGARHTDVVVSALKPLLEGTDLKADPVKQKALDRANIEGGTFSTVFLLFAQFSIAAGVLLIFLIFTMLATERQRELGIARAIGTQQGQVVRLFVFEGALYSLIAAAVGSVLGMLVGWGMVRIMAAAFNQVDFTLTYTFNWRSLVIAYALGMAVTFLVVLIASWRVSRINIIRAIRDIPEPKSNHKSLKGTILQGLLIVAGIAATAIGIREAQAGPYTLGGSLIIIGLPLLARRLGLKDRPAYTIAGLGLVAWWLLPEGWHQTYLHVPDMKAGIEMFFLSGILMVLGGVWAVIYNTDLFLRAIVAVLGRFRGLSAVVRMAVSYPNQARFRTGMTLVMVSLVVFTLVVMAFIIGAIGRVLGDADRISGGFQLRAGASMANPIPDITAAIRSNGTLNPDDFSAIGSLLMAPVKAKPGGSTAEPVDLYITGADAGYTDNVTYGFSMMAPGFGSPREIWQAVQNRPDVTVVGPGMVPAKENYNVGGAPPELQFEGFYKEDKVLPEVFLHVTDPRTGLEKDLQVIGVVEDMAFYAGSAVTSKATLDSLLGASVPAQSFMLGLRPGADAAKTLKELKAALVEHGLQGEVLATEIEKNTSAGLMINTLLQGFMSLGLVVGIAALGVIAARSVVERRQQIGVLRALGFQKGMVQGTFLIESSFITLLGIGIGVALALGLSPQLINSFKKSFEGMTYEVPWVGILVVVVLAYLASLLTTFLPSRQASQVYPAEALRYE